MANLSPEVFRQDQKHGRLYTVRRGDTAGDIARLHGIRLPDLIAANDLDKRATIFVSQNLRIPLSEEKKPPIAVGSENIKSERVQPPSPSPPKNEKPATAGPTGITVATAGVPKQLDEVDASSTEPPAKNVQIPTAVSVMDGYGKAHFGDSPIAASPVEPVVTVADSAGYKPDVDLIDTDSGRRNAPPPPTAEGNEDSESTPPPEADNRSASDPASAAELDPNMVTGNLSIIRVILNDGRPIGIIQVEIEETIGHYAEWLGVRAGEIRHLNAIPYGQVIHIGQKLKIPLRRTAKEAFEEQRFEYHKELVEDFFSAYRVEAVQVYCIKKGDTLWTLANQEFELPLWLIRRYNPNTDLTT
jgi:membrane-bound lytic murein transglycosylase D